MSVDRAIGALCVVAAATVASAALVVGASTPPPPVHVETETAQLGPIDDPATIAAFLDYHTRAGQGAWMLEATWQRRQGDEVRLETTWRTVQDGTGDKLTEAFGNLRGVYRGWVVICGVVEDDRVVCDAGPAPDAVSRFEESAVIARELTTAGSGTYTVARAPTRTVLDEPTECFVLGRRAGHGGWAFGAETTFCYSEAAVPLLVIRREGVVVDTRTATSVSFEVDDSDFEVLLAPRADALATSDLRSAP